MTVCKIGGAVATDPDTIAALAAAYRQHTGRAPFVIVHGAGPQLNSALEAYGPPERIEGLRVTPPQVMPAIMEVMDDVGQAIVTALRGHGIQAVHVPTTATALHALPVTDPPGLGRVGHATSWTAPVAGDVFVTGCIGHDPDGPLNVNADSAARAIATSLGSERLVLATDVPHVRGADGQAIRDLSAEHAQRLIDDGTAAGGMAPKLRAAIDALRAGVKEVAIGAPGSAMTEGTRVFA